METMGGLSFLSSIHLFCCHRSLYWTNVLKRGGFQKLVDLFNKCRFSLLHLESFKGMLSTYETTMVPNIGLWPLHCPMISIGVVLPLMESLFPFLFCYLSSYFYGSVIYVAEHLNWYCFMRSKRGWTAFLASFYKSKHKGYITLPSSYRHLETKQGVELKSPESIVWCFNGKSWHLSSPSHSPFFIWV